MNLPREVALLDFLLEEESHHVYSRRISPQETCFKNSNRISESLGILKGISYSVDIVGWADSCRADWRCRARVYKYFARRMGFLEIAYHRRAGFIGSAVVRMGLNEKICEIVNLDCLTYAGILEPLSLVSSEPSYSLKRSISVIFRRWKLFFQNTRPIW